MLDHNFPVENSRIGCLCKVYTRHTKGDCWRSCALGMTTQRLNLVSGGTGIFEIQLVVQVLYLSVSYFILRLRSEPS